MCSASSPVFSIPVRRTRCDDDAVAGGDGEDFVAQRHRPVAAGDGINLHAGGVAVQQRCRARRHDGLGQALLAHRMQVRVQQFADFGAVPGDVGRDVGERRPMAHLPPQGWIGTLEIELAGAPSMILRLIAI